MRCVYKGLILQTLIILRDMSPRYFEAVTPLSVTPGCIGAGSLADEEHRTLCSFFTHTGPVEGGRRAIQQRVM